MMLNLFRCAVVALMLMLVPVTSAAQNSNAGVSAYEAQD